VPAETQTVDGEDEMGYGENGNENDDENENENEEGIFGRDEMKSAS
jgi:hypothetical protein